MSAWDRWVERLQQERCRFRMVHFKRSSFIYIREYREGTKVAEFSSRHWRHDSDADIEACAKTCLKAVELGGWEAAVGPVERGGDGHTWFTLMGAFWAQYSARVVKKSSQGDHRAFCGQVRAFNGPVRVARLEEWINATDPYVNWKKHKKQMQFLTDLRKYGFLGGEEFDRMIAEQKKRQPTKQERERVVGIEKPRAIPSDAELHHWLMSIESPLHRWAFAMVAVYGLRPSELWHLKGIDAGGFVMVPAKPLCKTFMHPARACPIDWIEEFGLRRNFALFHQEWLSRYKIQWQQDNAGRAVPLNNSRVADAGLAQQITRGKVKPLMGEAWDAGKDSGAIERCVVYDLRHAYAIRLWTSLETSHLPMSKHAYWMGHSLQQHHNTYLKWMPPALLMAAEQESFEASASQAAPAANSIEPASRLGDAATASVEIAALMAELEKLKRQNAKQRKMIDALQDED